MMRKLTGSLGALALLWSVAVMWGGCTPTDRNFATGGMGGQGGEPGCPAGFAECDGNPETVCETDTASSLDHCGTCNKACAPALDANIECVAGTCTIASCNNGRGNCDDFYDNGCETNPTTSFEHCGTCKNSCEAPDAITACVGGGCALAQCVNGKLDCDMDPKTGCEVDPTSNVDHCSGCGMACTLPNATMECVNSACGFVACNANFGDCNMNQADGCEVDFLSSPYHCNACGNSCNGGVCNAGVCNPPILVAISQQPPGKIAVFKGEMFIGPRANGDISTVPTTGGIPKLLSASPGLAYALATNGDVLAIAGSQGTMTIPFDGSNKVTYGTQTARGIAFAGNDLYWTALNAIRFSPIGAPPGSTFFSAPTTALGLFIFKSDTIYWTLSDGSVWSSSLVFGLPKQLVLGPGTPNNIVADDTHIFWSSTKGLHSATVAGADFKDLAKDGTIRSVALDGNFVYWTDEIPGHVKRIAKDGSTPAEILALDQKGPYGLALDTQFIYWSNSDSGEIWKLPK